MKKQSTILFVILTAVLLIGGMGGMTGVHAGSLFETIQETGVVIEGDVLYDFDAKQPMVGVGMPLVTAYDDMFEVRAELAGNLDDVTLIGMGIGIDIIKAVNSTIDLNNIMGINPRIGIIGMVDMNSGFDGMRPVGYISIVEKPF